MKTLKNLIGAKTLSKKEQINVKGGGQGGYPVAYCNDQTGQAICPDNSVCEGHLCIALPTSNGGGTNSGPFTGNHYKE